MGAGTALTAVGILALTLAPAAEADVSFGSLGAGAGQTDTPAGVAVDMATGDLFVSDRRNKRVDVFDADGNFVRGWGWNVSPDGAPGDTAVDAFEICTSACQVGQFGPGAGQFGSNANANRGPDSIAVDNDPSSPSYQDVYVYDRGNARIQRFTREGAFVLAFGDGVNQTTGGDVCTAVSGDVCKAGVQGLLAGQLDLFGFLAVGQDGEVFVADGFFVTDGLLNPARIQVFDSEGILLSQPLTSTETFRGIAADATGNFYAATSAGIGKYASDGTCLNCSPPSLNPSTNITGLAVDRDSGNILVADNAGVPESTGASVINIFGPSEIQLAAVYGTGLRRMIGLAARNTPSGDFYSIHDAGAEAKIIHVPAPPPGPLVLPGPEITRADPIGNVTATLRSRVNPEGKASTVRFQYVDDESFQSEGGFASPSMEETGPVSPDPIGSDFQSHAASSAVSCPMPEVELPEGKCLKAETKYHFRAIAASGDGTDTGDEATFETSPPIVLGPVWATDVGGESARLHAELSPEGLNAKARFEYVTDAAYQDDLQGEGDGFGVAMQTGELNFGDDDALVERSALALPLEPGTTYHYRYVADNFFGEFTGPEKMLHTPPPNAKPKVCSNQQFRIGPSTNLPDCRAYELVSPLGKANGDIINLKEAGAETVLGKAFARIVQARPGGDALTYSSQRAFGDAVSAPYSSQYTAGRDPSAGWLTHSLNPPRKPPTLYLTLDEHHFKALSEDLCSAWFVQDTDLPLVPGAPPGVPNLYRRVNCGQEGYELITTVPPPGWSREAEVSGSFYYPTLQGFSADSSVSAFKAAAAMTAEGSISVGATLDCPAAAKASTITYQWLRGGAPIAGKTEPTYETTNGDKGKAIQCQVFASGPGVGATQVATPAQVVAPAPAIVPPASPVSITAPQSDAPLVVGGGGGQTLTCNPEEVEWGEAPTSFAYRWYRNGASIAGKTEATYLVTAGDLASPASFQCLVIATNAGGSVGKASGGLLSSPAPEPLPPNPNPGMGDFFRAYLRQGDRLRLVSVLPDGTVPVAHASVGTALGSPGSRIFDSVLGAVSEDGSRVFWSAAIQVPAPAHSQAGLGPPGPSRLYLRLNAGATETTLEDGKGNCVPDVALACTIEISKGAAIFRAASPDGDKAIYTESEGSDEGLYEVDVAKAVAGDMEARKLIAKETEGLLGASKDLSRVYFASAEAISGAKPNQAGEDGDPGGLNLYLYEVGGGTTFVAPLVRGLGVTSSDERSLAASPASRSSRVNSDGLYAVFISQSPAVSDLAADYDNTDANSGKPAAEVFIYDASEGSLRCVSCNPSGARPAGQNISPIGKDVWTAAHIPGWETQFQPSRPLSDDGKRVFFDSFEGLVSRDTNEAQDVYEWVRVTSEKECIEEIGGELFSPSSGGCLALISSGLDSEDAEFLDASESGSDVFFTTSSSLVPQDPGLIDVYNAREGGGFPIPLPPVPPCEGEVCQSPPSPPEDPTPASSSFRGRDNLQSGKRAKRCPKGKRKVRRGGRSRCVSKHRQRPIRRAPR